MCGVKRRFGAERHEEADVRNGRKADIRASSAPANRRARVLERNPIKAFATAAFESFLSPVDRK